MRAPFLLCVLLVPCLACRRSEAPAASTAASTPTTATAAAPGTAPSTAVDPAVFVALETHWAEALGAHDLPALEGLLAPEFLITGVGSTAADPVGGRAEWLDKVPQHPWPHHDVLDVHVAVAAPDAIVVKCVWRGVYPPESITDVGGIVNLLETDVWVHRNDRWQVLARHTSLPRPE
jgi:hypothetical protein